MSTHDHLGRYELTEVLGTGAMGVVYKGFDPGIQRTVAIKTIRRELIAGDRPAAALLARFQNEARAAGRLAHPGIVAVYDYGEDASVAYIAMEYVEGNSLREYFSRGTRFAERDVVSIMAQLLEALAHAHERRVWHRDIKPANLIVMMNGRVKVADFGIARIEASDLTQTGAVMGSPGYMAPEQYTAAAIDHRADIFAAGVVFYQLLTGSRPFVGSADKVAYAICHTEAALPSAADPGKGWERYDAIIAKALAKRPEDRYPSADAFRVALLAAYAGPVAATVSEETIITEILRPAAAVDASSPSRQEAQSSRAPAPPAPEKPPRHWGWIAAGSLAVALAAAAVTWLVQTRNAAPLPPVEPAAAVPPVSSPPPRAQTEQEMVFWESVRNSKSRAELEAYLAKYPDGAFAPLARARLGALAEAEKARAEAEEKRATEEKRAAEAKRAAEEKHAAEQRRLAAAKPKPQAAAPTPPPTQLSVAKWQGTIACQAYAEKAPINGGVDVSASGSSLVVQRGARGQPGSFAASGIPMADGTLKLVGVGVSALAKARGKLFAARFDGKLEGDRYNLSGQLGMRECTLSIPRGDPGRLGATAAVPPFTRSSTAGGWQGAIACDAVAGRPSFSTVVEVSTSEGSFLIERGAADQPGSFALRGTPTPDGSLKLVGSGISVLERTRGKPYPATIEGRFENDRYNGSGRLGARHCTLAIARTATR